MQSSGTTDTPGNWNELWAVVGESLFGGVHHALNNRVAALSAISQVLGSGMPDAGPILASLSGEVNRLEETVALLSLLRRARTRRPEPVQVAELVGTLAPLLAQHNDLKEIVFTAAPDPGILPAWAERDQLTRILLTLMVAVGVDAEWAGCRKVRVAYRGNEAIVTIRIACERNGEGTTESDPDIRRIDARAAEEAVRAMDGQLEAKPCVGGDTAYELSLPTLLAARKAGGG